MKNIFKKTMLCASTVVFCAVFSTASFADERKTIVRCTTSQVADGGYDISIVSVGIYHVKQALIKEVKRVATEVSDIVAVRQHNFGTHVEFTGDNFKLTVQLESRSSTPVKRGLLHYGNEVQDVTCEFPEK